MTKEELMKAFEMRIDGYTYEEIADELHYTKMNICDALHKVCETNVYIRRKNKRKDYQYPNLAKYIFDNYTTLADFCRANDIPYNTMRGILTGRSQPSMKLAMKLNLRTKRSVDYLFVTKKVEESGD